MKKILFALLGASVLTGCGNDQKTQQPSDTETHATSDAAHSDEATNEAIELNQGEKWAVNEEMKPFIKESQNLVKEYNSAGSTDYKTLASQLKTQTTGLIKSCTMKGKSHDELHKWLHPYMEQVENLSKAEDEALAEQHLADIEKSFDIYHAHFE